VSVNGYVARTYGVGGWFRLMCWLAAGVVAYGLWTDHTAAPETAAPVKVGRAARAGIPARYLVLYQREGRRYGVPWTVLAAIGKVESDHGRSSAPGVRSGVNRFGCCAGPMQFNLTNGPPSTWDRYGRGSPYRAADAIAAAARYLRAAGARTDLRRAVYAYNHSWAYVRQVLGLARRYGGR